MTVGNVAGVSLLQLINHHRDHSVCPKVTKGYSAAMDTFLLYHPPADEWRYQARVKVLIRPKHTAAGQAIIITFGTFREIYFDGEFVCL